MAGKIARMQRRHLPENGTGTVAAITLACRGGDQPVPSFDNIFNAFVTILVTIDPPGLAPLFLAVTRGMNRDERRQVSIRASIIGFAVMALFAVAGASILSIFGITLPAFRVAGGFLLFFIAFEMVFERRQDRKEKISDVAITKDMIHNIAAFPLAIPLIAGPGAISATVLLSGSFQGFAAQATLVGIILACLVLTYLVFVLSERIDRFLGQTGRSILTRLLGVILAALAVQFVADGVKALVAG
jgi:multiple antibiotic resistance protein